MANYSNLLAVIAANIYQNNNNEVTADMVKTAMNEMVNSLGDGFQEYGFATPDGSPSHNSDVKAAYLAILPGQYTNYGGFELNDEQIAIFTYTGSWASEIHTMLGTARIDSALFKEKAVEATGVPASSTSVPLSGDFYLKAGVSYALKGVFNAQPAAGSEARVYVLAAGTTTPAIAQISLLAASWDTEKSAAFSVTKDGMYYLVYRYISTAPGVSLTAHIDNPLYYQVNGALSLYKLRKGVVALGALIVGKTWGNDDNPVTNGYRLSTQIFRWANSHFKVSCNYAGGYSYYIYKKVNGAFVGIATNQTTDKEFTFEASEMYVAVRAGGNLVTDADVAACGLVITLLEDTYRIVPDVDKEAEKLDAKIDSVADILISDYSTQTQFPADDTAITRASDDFFMKAGLQYTFKAQFDAEPTEDAQVNLWIFKTGTTSGNIGRVILYGGESWDGPRSVVVTPQEDGQYYIGYRVIYGGVQSVTISASIDNPFSRPTPDDESSLPEYYFPYIDERVLAAKREMAKCGAGSAAMFFITDTHHPQNYGQSGRMLRYLSERLQIRTLLYGGDICPSLTSSWGGKEESAEDALYLSDNAITIVLSNVIAKIYRVKGNHDYSVANYKAWESGKTYKAGDVVVWAASNTGGVGDNYSYTCLVGNSDVAFDPDKWDKGEYGGHNLSQIESQRLILADAEANAAAVFPNNGTKGAYYYFDVPRSKMRVLCWDTSDSDLGFTGISNVTERISDEQFKWMIEEAILTTPAGYSIVCLSHIPAYINQSIGRGTLYETATWEIAKRSLYAAVNGKTSVTIGGVSYDFANFAPNIILDLAGHTHADCITKVDGLFAISTAGDWWSDHAKDSPVYQHFGITSLASRVGGTTKEQSFDVVVFDPANDYIKFLRIGAGIDRFVKLTQESVEAGSTLQITSDLTGTLEYYVFDANLRSSTPAANGYYYPTQTLASIDSDGLLTAIAAGEVVVMAYDTDNEIVEVFGVTIE